MKKRERAAVQPPSIFGLSLLFVTFLILCLFTLAALTLSGARNDYRASRQLAEHTTAYYAASNQAEAHVAALNAEVAEAPSAAADTVSFSVPVSDEESLEVSLRLQRTGGDDAARYVPTQWLVVNHSSWHAAETMSLPQIDES